MRRKFKRLTAFLLSAAMVFPFFGEYPSGTFDIDWGFDWSVSAEDTTPDFSDAKVLTAVDGALYINDVALTINTDQFGETSVIIPEGNYMLTGNIATDTHIYTEGSINLDLNGYTWDMSGKQLILNNNATLSLYDTDVNKTGKITTSSRVCTIRLSGSGSTFNLYSGTVENTSNEVSAYGVNSNYGSSNLYGGTIKSNSYAVSYNLKSEITINIDNTSFDCGDGYAQIYTFLSSNEEPCAVIDVSDYEGGALTVDARIGNAGEIKIFTGIQSAQDAEKYTVNVWMSNADLFEEKQEYEEDDGNKYVYVSATSFTKQPTKGNGYTVAFNHPDATLQWCEVTVLKSATYSEAYGEHAKSYEVNAGDALIVSLSECSDDFGVDFDCSYNEESLYMFLDSSRKTASVTFDSACSVRVNVMLSPYGTGEYKIEHVRYTELEGETDVQLSKTECETTYACKATVGERVYYSDEVTIEQKHNCTCTATSDNVITKECANCGKSGTLTITAEGGVYDGTTAYGATVEKTGIFENEEVAVNYYKGDTSIGTAPVDEGTYTAKITYEDVTASVEFTINHADSDNDGYCDGCDAIYDGIGAHLAGYSVSLNGSIGVNFHMDLTQDVLDDDEAYMLFTLPNGTTQKVMVSDARAKEPAVIEGKKYYIFTCNVAAKEMTDTIQAQLITSDGSKTQVYEYSVREYADTILFDMPDSYDYETKELVEAMLHYGAYSQEWFDYNTTNLANERLDILDLSEADNWDEFNPIITNDEKVGSFTSAYLTLESDTAINLKFKLADGVSFEDLRVVVQDTMRNVVPATTVTTENVCLITLTGIKASDLDTMYTFCVTDKEGNESAILYSAMSYARAVAKSEMDQKLKDLTTALRIFNLKADDKFEC